MEDEKADKVKTGAPKKIKPLNPRRYSKKYPFLKCLVMRSGSSERPQLEKWKKMQLKLIAIQSDNLKISEGTVKCT